MTRLTELFEYRQSSQRIWVDCSGCNPIDEMDRCCQLFQSNDCRVAVLDDSPGALISNISIMENLWLPQAWPGGLSLSEFRTQFEELVTALLPILPESLHDLIDLTNIKPGMLSVHKRKLVVLMRAALMKPEFLLIAPSWVSALTHPSDHLLSQAMHLSLYRATWLAFDEIDPSSHSLGTAWARAESLSLRG